MEQEYKHHDMIFHGIYIDTLVCNGTSPDVLTAHMHPLCRHIYFTRCCVPKISVSVLIGRWVIISALHPRYFRQNHTSSVTSGYLIMQSSVVMNYDGDQVMLNSNGGVISNQLTKWYVCWCHSPMLFYCHGDVMISQITWISNYISLLPVRCDNS